MAEELEEDLEMQNLYVNATTANASSSANDSNTKSKIPHIEWGEDHINILVEWADKALCYRWLHSKAHAGYSISNTWFTIPVIIMSTLAGTANFAQDKFPESIRQYATMGIGAINLFSGILTTIQQYLKISELNEAHRVATIAWDKFYRNTKVELAKSPNERIPVVQMIKHCKEEFDRLMETSPPISEDIIKAFMSTFSSSEHTLASIESQEKHQDFKHLKKPEICDALESTRKSVFDPKKMGFTSEPQQTVRNSITGNDLQTAIKKMDLKHKQKKINSVIAKFNKEKHRDPLIDEIMSELDNKIELDIVKSVLLYNSKKDKNNDNAKEKSNLSIDIMSDCDDSSSTTSKST
jgi:uncharacterized protein YneF (UPF0154 family)